jgi:hypothetical protein
VTERETLLEKRAKIKQTMWEIEQLLKNMAFVSAVDFASMYPGVIRLLNASIESLVGFLDDDPIVYRTLGLSETVLDAKEKSKELVKTTIKDSKYVQFVGKKEDKVSLRRDLYNGKYDDATIEEITETPFERYFLANMGLFDADDVMLKFQGKVYSAAELKEYFEEMDYSVSGSGAVYKRSMGENGELGLIPSYLEFLFFERKRVKKAMFVHYKNKLLLQKFKMAAAEDGLL